MFRAHRRRAGLFSILARTRHGHGRRLDGRLRDGSRVAAGDGHTRGPAFLLAGPVRPVSAKSVDGPGPGQDFAGVRNAARYHVLLSCLHRYALPIHEQRVAALDHQHIFVVVVDVLRGRRRFLACPERHLAAVGSVEYVSLDSRRRLVSVRNPVRRLFHERREISHKSIHNCRIDEAGFAARSKMAAKCTLKVWNSQNGYSG